MKGGFDSELFQAQAHVWNQILHFINSMTLKCAIQLGIPDTNLNHQKPTTINELINAPPIHPAKAQYLYRLMRILVYSGFFARQKLSPNDQEQGYILTSASKLLLKDNPLSARPFLQAVLDPVLTTPWEHVTAWFQNDDRTPFDAAHGMAFWEYTSQEPIINNLFNEAMASDARLETRVLASRCKDVFEGMNSLVDVGGGTGTVAKAIVKAFPHIECTVFDLPNVVADTKSDIDNFKYVGGNMFEEVPPTDAVLLKNILHDWNDEDCVKILENCKKAITINGKVGKLIIIDMILGNIQETDDKSVETQLFFDLSMMVFCTGKERDEKEWATLFLKAGFNSYKITPIFGLRSLIEVYP